MKVWTAPLFTPVVLLLQWVAFLPLALAEELSPSDTQAITVAIRTQRDLSLSLPLNRATGPGLVLETTILSKNYTIETFQLTEKLLATLVRRVVVDIYWDNNAKIWQMCPEPYPPNTAASQTSITDTVRVGDVVCSAIPLTFDAIGKQVPQWLVSNSGGEYLNAVVAIILNLHDLKVANLSPANASTPFQTLGQSVRSPRVYTPKMLSNYRAVNSSTSPYSNVRSGNVTNISESWPSGVELVNAGTQILIGFGTSDLNNSSGYDVDGDKDVIFSSEELRGVPSIVTTMFPGSDVPSCAAPGSGISMQGTGFDLAYPRYNGATGSGQTTVSWSWPYVMDAPSKPFTPALIKQLVSCGFIPLYNVTFSLEMLSASVWSWEPGQPSASSGRDCAFIRKSTGRWSVDVCKAAYPVACQLRSGDASVSDPFNWTIVPQTHNFVSAASACPEPYVFAVPKNAQENAALAAVIAASDVGNVWINLNQVLPTCWAEGYQSKCPYTVTDTSYQAFIGATLKQGIVIVIVFALFVFFKCRRQMRVSRLSKRKAEVRRKIRQRDYVTVPA